MTTVLSVTIHGLAGKQKPVHYDLRRDLNIFFGVNGSGKTSLLKLLHAGLNDDSSGLERVPFESAKVQFYSAAQDRRYERSISSGDSKTSADSKNSNAVERRLRASVERRMQDRAINEGFILAAVDTAEDVARESRAVGEWVTNPGNTTLKRRMLHGYLSTNRLMGDTPRSGGTRVISDAELDDIFARQIQQVWQEHTNKLLSELTEVQSDGLREILRSLLFATPESIEQSSPEVKKAYERASHFLQRRPGRQNSSEFLEFQRRFKEEPHFRGVVQDIDRIERKIEQAEEPRRKLANLISNFFSDGKDLTFTNRGIQATVRGRDIPLALLSSGEKQLLRILIEVIATGDNVVIIDEPELSMHIDWQRELVQAMQIVNPNVQIIMATHSPDVMEHVPDECIFRL